MTYTKQGVVIIEDYEISTQPVKLGEKRNSPVVDAENKAEEPLPKPTPKELPNFTLNVVPPTTSDSRSDAGIAVFDLDEEVINKESKATEEKPSEEEEEEEITYQPYQPAKVATDLFGTSLPISIPRFNSNAAPSTTYHPESRFQKDKESKEVTLSEKLSPDSNDLSKSFDVPISRSRRMSYQAYI